MNLIASSTPGRIRLRHVCLRDPVRLERLSTAVRRWRGVTAIETNPRVGSLLLHYDAGQTGRGGFEGRLIAATRRLWPNFDTLAGAGTSRRHKGTPRVRVNRWAKRGMLLSLAISLLLAGAGRKRWHALAGGLFVASLAVHLWAHRQHVLR